MMDAKERIAFDKGYICAVANIISIHDAPVIAKDVLLANPPNDWAYIDEYDRKIISDAGLIPELKGDK